MSSSFLNELFVIPVDDISLEYGSADFSKRVVISALLKSSECQYLVSVLDPALLREMAGGPERWSESPGMGLVASDPDNLSFLVVNALLPVLRMGEDALESICSAIGYCIAKAGKDLEKRIAEYIEEYRKDV